MTTGVLRLEAEAQSLFPGLLSHLFFLIPLQALPFSHLILATGSTGPFPGKFNEVSCQQAAIQAYEDMVKQVCHTDGCETGRAGRSAVGHGQGSGWDVRQDGQARVQWATARAQVGRLWEDIAAG